MGSVEEVSRLLDEWDNLDAYSRSISSILNDLSDVFERETQNFYKQDPDPFDDRHPSRSQPDCTLGHILKSIFRHKRLVDELYKVYVQRVDVTLLTAACRLLLNILPGLENDIFQEVFFVQRLFTFADAFANPLQSYAIGLLAAAMDNSEIASNHKEKNASFVPLMLKGLHIKSKSYFHGKKSCNCCNDAPECVEGDDNWSPFLEMLNERKNPRKNKIRLSRYNPIYSENREREKQSTEKSTSSNNCTIDESSNSSCTDVLGRCIQIFPLSLASQQIYILQYLATMGEYQELIGHVLEQNTLMLILQYIEPKQNRDIRLKFEALKYLAALLNHKKVAIEFLNAGGLKYLLKVPYTTIAAAGVSFCLYYLGYIEEALERISMAPSEVIKDLISYALYLLECSHDSSRCHATLFLGFTFRYKILLHEFDRQDGLRKLYNVMSTLEIYVSREARPLTEDDIFGERITTKHVCGSLKKYFEGHLAVLTENIEVTQPKFPHIDMKPSLNEASMAEAVEKSIDAMLEFQVIPLYHWTPVNIFVSFDGVTFLLELIYTYLETGNSSTRAETIKSALDVLKVCSLTVPVQLKFCEKLSERRAHITGFSALLEAAVCQTSSPEIKCSALLTLINCACSKATAGSVRKTYKENFAVKRMIRIDDLMNKIRKVVRIKNGIIVLINLLSTKTPETDADYIRALACKALCGFARSEDYQQIISKLPLITDGQLIDLMREPVHQDQYHHHVQFCKYGRVLLQRVTGASFTQESESLDLSKLANSEIVTNTKIVYNQNQLMSLIYVHLKDNGFHKSAQCLRQEMNSKRRPSCGRDRRITLLNPLPSRYICSYEPKVGNNSKNCTSSPQISCTVPFIPPSCEPLQIKKNKPIPFSKSPLDCTQKPQMSSGSFQQSAALVKRSRSFSSFREEPNTLDSIVTYFLRKQHSLCKNPVLTCPPFDLFKSHKCPEPQNKKNAPANFVTRLQNRELSFVNGGYGGAAMNTKHIYGRFRLFRAYRDHHNRHDFNTVEFYNYKDDYSLKILLGCDGGTLQVLNMNTRHVKIYSKNCHIRGVANIESRKESPLILTSDGSRIGASAIWKIGDDDLKLVDNLYEISHLEFCKINLDKMIATTQDGAALMDSKTYKYIHQYIAAKDYGNNYAKNRATIDYSDNLILSDGLLYDVRSADIVHKLDKFNSIMNGVFHPNGREIICNSEIWDIRTFNLLRSVVGLDTCRVTFNDLGNVIYAVAYKDSLTGGKTNCFYTYDASNYNIITTADVKKPIYDIATDRFDKYVCTVEGINSTEYMCRIYQVGRTKQAGDGVGVESSDSSDDDNSDGEGQTSEVQLEIEDDGDNNDEDNDDNDISERNLLWWSELETSDEESLFSLNTSNSNDN